MIRLFQRVVSACVIVAGVIVAGAIVVAVESPGLLDAVHQGDHAMVRTLLRAGADVNAADADRTTALMHAVIEADVDMLKVLLDAGADVNAKNALGSTALLYAVTDLAKTRLLLDRGAEVTVRNQRGATPMKVAALGHGSTPILRLLAAKGAPTEDSMMTSVAQHADLEAMQFLLSLGVSAGGSDSAALAAALGARCDACATLLIEKGAPATGVRTNGAGVLTQSVRRANVEMSQLMLDHGAPLDIADREGFDLLMQAVLSMEPLPQKEAMIRWLLAKGLDPNARNARGETAYLLATRMGQPSILDLLVKAGATPLTEEWPRPIGRPRSAREAVGKALPLMETSGEAVFKNRGCISCHNNSLPQMAIALATKKGFAVDDAQVKKELEMAIATERAFFEPMRAGSAVGGGSDTVGYTLMGMAAGGYPKDALTDAHIHYLSIYQYPDGAWRTTAYRPPTEYGPFSTTAVALTAIRLYPLPGRHKEFEERMARAKTWLLAAAAVSAEEKAMQLTGLAAAGASVAEREPFVRALKAAQNADGSWSLLPGIPGEAYATGAILYTLHVNGNVPVTDPVYQKGVEWLLKNQMEDGSWFTVTRTPPGQPQFDTGFPHGRHQFISDAATSWASMVLLFTLPDTP